MSKAAKITAIIIFVSILCISLYFVYSSWIQHTNVTHSTEQSQDAQPQKNEGQSAQTQYETNASGSIHNSNDIDINSSITKNLIEDSKNENTQERPISKDELFPQKPSAPQTIPEKSSSSYLPISKLHCESNCEQFTQEPDRKYCQEVCGILNDTETIDCSEKNNLELDYCTKNQAINNNNSSLCNKIKDNNIKTTCLNRILENIVDKQQEL